MKFTPFSKKDIELLKKTIKLAQPYKLRFIFTFFCILSGIVLSLIHPLIWGNLLSQLFQKKYDTLTSLLALLIILYFIQTIVMFFQSYFINYINENIIFDIQTKMYIKILNLPVVAFDNMSVGEFLSRLQGDTNTIAKIISEQLLNTIVDVIKVIAIGIFVFYISPVLAFIALITFPLTYIAFFFFGNKLRKLNEIIKELNDGIYSNTEQSIFSIREIKSLGIKKTNINIFIDLCKNLRTKKIKTYFINGIASCLSLILTFLSQILIYSVGAFLIYKDMLSIEFFIAFTSYSQQFTGSLNNITRLNSNIQEALVSLERIFSLIDDMYFTQESFGEKTVENILGNINFNNVSFSYSDGTHVFKDLNLNIKPNKKYAIVGSSGSGKSTVFNLLLRLYNPTSGEIVIDGINIQEYNEKSLRKHITAVRQDPLLFNLSIYDNLRLANPSSTIEEIKSACCLANIDDFINSLPNGYDTLIMENGANFSGGQKQRLAIARAILRNSKIILFDEITSALDNESQYKIKKTINKLSETHTIIIITHRLFNVIDADKILVIDNGKIVGAGNHQKLILENQIYKHLYEKEMTYISEAK